MALCTHPTCHRNDELCDDDMYMEYMEMDDTWVPVCWQHVDRDSTHVELTDETREMDGEELMAQA